MLEDYDLSRSLNIISLIVIIGSFEGIFIGVFLLLKKSVKFKANLWLGILVLTVTTYILPGAIYRIGLLPDLPHVTNLHMITVLLMGPTAYLYVRSCTQKDFEMRPILWLHFLPLLLAIGYHLPFLLSSGEKKVAAFFKFSVEGDLGIPKIVSLAKVLHPAIYAVICIRLVLEYRKHLSNNASYVDVAFHRWLLLFSVVLLLPLFSVSAFVLTSFKVFSATTFFSIFFLFIIAVHLAAMVKPELFHAFPHQMLLPESAEEQKQKYESSKLQDTQKDKYIEKLQAYTTEHKPYLAPELTLGQLSEQVNIPAHYVSQVVNEKLDCNFLDFINGYRVEEAKAKLVNPKFSHYTIMGVAHDAGFNSKSTFYTAFKKHTGMTPSQYRKQQLATSR